jgi:hypothetical protein
MYFDEGAYASLPLDGSKIGQDYTVEGWFIWLSGTGPLLQTDDDALALIYDRDGECAYMLGGAERVTVVPSQAAKDRWIYVAVAKTRGAATLRLNEGVVDRWDSAPDQTGTLSDLIVMKDAVGFAADIAIYGRALPDDRLDAHWEAGKDRV